MLAVGRYRGDELEYLESVLSVRINHADTSALVFKYQTDDGDSYGLVKILNQNLSVFAFSNRLHHHFIQVWCSTWS